MKVQRQIDRATSISRTEALKASEKSNEDRVPLVVTYHPDLLKLNTLLRDHLSILHISEWMKKAVPDAPLVTNRRPRNLKDDDLLVRMSMKPPLPSHEGSSRCGRTRCKTCAHIQTGIRFTSVVTAEVSI